MIKGQLKLFYSLSIENVIFTLLYYWHLFLQTITLKLYIVMFQLETQVHQSFCSFRSTFRTILKKDQIMDFHVFSLGAKRMSLNISVWLDLSGSLLFSTVLTWHLETAWLHRITRFAALFPCHCLENIMLKGILNDSPPSPQVPPKSLHCKLHMSLPLV